MLNDLPIVTAVSLSNLFLVLQTQDLQLVCYAFTAFGKAAIKQKKLHPDTFVQLAIQLAYYRLHEKYGLVHFHHAKLTCEVEEAIYPESLFLFSQARKLL